MFSTQITTSSLAKPWDIDSPSICVAGSRIWQIVGTGTVNPGGTPNQGSASAGINLYYSDDNGATFTYHSNVNTGTGVVGAVVAYQDSGSTWRLHILIYNQNSTSAALAFRSCHSNVASGTPGALTTSINVDAGGANAGISGAGMFVTNTVTNPRVWIVGRKTTAASTITHRAWYVGTGTSGDTAANWTTTNFTTLTTAGNFTNRWAFGVAWGTSAKATIFCADENLSPDGINAFTFDPTATTPTPGTAIPMAQSGALEGLTEGPVFTAAATASYCVLGRRGASSGTTWQWYKTTDGTTWSQPTGWTALSMGRAAVCTDGTDFYIVYTGPAALAAGTSTAVDSVYYRVITSSSDTMGAQTAFSDTTGNHVACVYKSSKLVGTYRAAISTTYPIRADSVSFATDTTPPVVNLTTSLTYKMSDETGKDSYGYSFSANEDIQAWKIKVVSSTSDPHTAGSLVESGGPVTSGVAVTGSITYAELVAAGVGAEGDKRLAVFVQDIAGNWSVTT